MGREPIEVLLDELEAPSVDRAVSPHSSLGGALLSAATHPAAEALARRARHDGTVLAHLAQRTREIVFSREFDRLYASPFDSTLLAILAIVQRSSPTLVPWFAETISNAPNIFLAAQAARDALGARRYLGPWNHAVATTTAGRSTATNESAVDVSFAATTGEDDAVPVVRARVAWESDDVESDLQHAQLAGTCRPFVRIRRDQPSVGTTVTPPSEWELSR